jgi:hypothetical protein
MDFLTAENLAVTNILLAHTGLARDIYDPARGCRFPSSVKYLFVLSIPNCSGFQKNSDRNLQKKSFVLSTHGRNLQKTCLGLSTHGRNLQKNCLGLSTHGRNLQKTCLRLFTIIYTGKTDVSPIKYYQNENFKN